MHIIYAFILFGKKIHYLGANKPNINPLLVSKEGGHGACIRVGSYYGEKVHQSVKNFHPKTRLLEAMVSVYEREDV